MKPSTSPQHQPDVPVAVTLLIAIALLWWLMSDSVIRCVCYVLYQLWSLVYNTGGVLHVYAGQRINLLSAVGNNAGDVPLSDFIAVLNQTGSIGLVALIPLVGIGLWVVWKHPSTRTQRVININTLPDIMKDLAPALLPVLTYGDKQQLLNDTSEEQRPAQHPEEFVKEHGLVVNQRLDKPKTEAVLTLQLGQPMQGDADARIAGMKPWERALMAVFALAHCLDEREQATKLLDTLNIWCIKQHREEKNAYGYPAFCMAENEIARVSAHPDVRAHMMRHRYSRTALAALHDNDMHLPSSQFRWLKGLDRTLWYSLTSTGRPSPYIEGAGVVSVMQWERLAAQHNVKLDTLPMHLLSEGLELDLMTIGIVLDDSAVTPEPDENDTDTDEDDEDTPEEDVPASPRKSSGRWSPAHRPH